MGSSSARHPCPLAHPPVPARGWRLTSCGCCRVILAVLFLKYVVFEDPTVARPQTKSRADNKTKVRPAQQLAGESPEPPLSCLQRAARHSRSISVGSPVPAILSQLAYDLPTHPPETLDWLNVLLAQTLVAYRTLVSQSTKGNGGAQGLMEEMLNRRGNAEGDGETQPGLIGIDAIVVAEVVVGDKFPVLSNARVRPSGEDGGVVRSELPLLPSPRAEADSHVGACVVAARRSRP